jgi:hypothetical protein
MDNTDLYRYNIPPNVTRLSYSTMDNTDLYRYNIPRPILM